MYLGLPTKHRLVPGHCFIAPVDHLTAAAEFDENVFEELTVWWAGLIKPFVPIARSHEPQNSKLDLVRCRRRVVSV